MIEIGRADLANDQTRFEIDLARNYIPSSLSVRLDGRQVPVDSAGFRAIVGPVALVVPAAAGQHVVTLRARFMTANGRVTRIRRFSYSVPVPNNPNVVRVLSSWPSRGTKNLSIGEWIQLDFSAPPSPDFELAFSLRCSGRRVRFETYRVHETYWLLNPRGQLPPKARCVFNWVEAGTHQQIEFFTATAGKPAFVEYDRDEPGLSSPFPDDYFTRSDRSSPTRRRIDLPRSSAPSSLDSLAGQLEADVQMLDGFSPVGHIFVAVSDAIDPASLPHGAEESVHPASSVQLIDVDPRSESFGRRLPFAVEQREDLDASGELKHSLLLFPLVPTRLGGRIAVVLTRALRASPGRPFQPSPFMHRLFQPAHQSDSDAIRRARQQLGSALWVVENVAYPPIPRHDLALIVSYSTGSLEGLSRDLLHMRSQLREIPLPTFSIDRIALEEGDVSAFVFGTWHAPKWLDGDNIARDADGLPEIVGTTPIEFTLALPRERGEDGAPIVIYQHGNPGDAESEVPIEARRSLASGGFAVLGFTDIFNRELARDAPGDTTILTQLVESLLALDRHERLPEYWLATHAEQLAFLRLVEALRGFDVLPLEQADGRPDVDPDAPLSYLGVSEGANHAPPFLAYAPEVRSAVLVAGGAPIAETLTHQLDLSLSREYPQVLMGGEGRDIWLGLSLLQTAIDRQDPFHHARYLYREPVPVDGDLRKPSVLLIAGLEDTLIPNRLTDALAWLLGPIPMIEPTPRDVGFLPTAVGPIRANVDASTTAAYAQVVPAGLAGIEVESDCDPSSMSASIAQEGHFCAQVSMASVEQRLQFFLSALGGGAPVVTNTSIAEQRDEQRDVLPEARP